MSEQKPPKLDDVAQTSSERDRRRAEALRANLRRRKESGAERPHDETDAR